MNPVITVPAADDQAAILRELMDAKKKTDIANDKRIAGMRSVSILSGKGGVGKSNLAVNLGLILGQAGLRTTILDADLGLANIDILFGVVPKYNLGHVMRGERVLKEIIIPINDKVSIIPGGAGLRELADLGSDDQEWFIDKLSSLDSETDMLIIDTSAGIHKNVLAFAVASDQTILLSTTEPTAIRDSYGMLKALCKATNGRLDIGLVINMARDAKDAEVVAERIKVAADQFLNFKIPYYGCVVWDSAVIDAVKQRKPLVSGDLRSSAERNLRDIAYRLIDPGTESEANSAWGRGIKAFISRLAKHLTVGD